MDWLLAIVIASLPLVLGEWLHKLGIKREAARKTIHVLGAVASCSLLIFLTLNQIALLAGVFVVVLAVVRRKKLVKALYEVERKSFGEILFPAGVCLAAIAADTSVAYMFGVLVMGFSDAAASIVGGRYGKKKYQSWVGPGKKTYVGSMVFFGVTLSLGLLFTWFDQSPYALTSLLATCAVLTLLEAELSYGIDNVVIPIAATIWFQTVVV
jgi:phytol kinase